MFGAQIYARQAAQYKKYKNKNNFDITWRILFGLYSRNNKRIKKE
jgi:hypothetical protein